MTESEKIERATELCKLGVKLQTIVKQYNKYDHKINKYIQLREVLGTAITETKKRMKELGWRDEFE